MHLSLVTIVTVSTLIFYQVSATTRSLRIASTATIADVYVNGTPLTGVTFRGRWWAPTTFTVPSTTSLIAVKFISSTRPDAFILSDGITGCSIFSSPATVRCVTAPAVAAVTRSWFLPTFVSSMWPNASVSSAASSVLVFSTPTFCTSANWMWTATPASVIYCRIRITPVVICPTLSVPNSVLNTTVVILTTPVRVRCNNGYAFNPRNALNNSIVTVCTGSGRWSPLPSSCQLILCPTLTVPNSVLNTSSASITSAVRVRCNDGYAIDPRDVLNNNYTTVCTSLGTWSPLPTLCQPVLCLPLNVPNSQLNTTVSNFTTAVRVRCNEGYAFDPVNALNNSIDTVCTSSGTWSPLPSSCQPVLCLPLNVPNSQLNTTVSNFTTAVRVRCNEGYAFDPVNALNNSIDTVCTSSGTWSPLPSSCQLVLCLPLNVLNSQLNTTVSNFTTAVRVRCNEGYAFDPVNALNNSIDTVCTSSGTWSPLPSSCQPVLCLPLNLLNSQLNTTVSNFTTAVRVRCNEGYAFDPVNALNNSIDTVCTSSGTWSPLPSSCQPVLCLPLNLLNSQLNTTVSNFTTAVRVRCNEGYAFDPVNALNNSIDTVCTSSGTWSPLPSSCQQILCPPLNLPNATLNTTATSITTAVRVRCSDGYANDPLNAQLRDYSVETVCTSTGTWSPFTYSCPRARLAAISGSRPAVAIAHLNDQFFVLRFGDTQVSVYNATSFQLLQQIPIPGYSGASYGIAASAINNYLYISDVSNTKVHRVDLSVTSPTPAVTSFSVPIAPTALSVNGAGNVLVGLYANYFGEYNSSGALVRTFTPNTMAFQALELNNGKWLISRFSAGKLSMINESGAITDTFSSIPTLTVNAPANMAIDAQGYILFTPFSGANVVRVVNPSLTDGRELPLPDITGLTSPLGLSFDRSRNRLYIGEFDGQKRVLVVLDGVANLNTLFNP